MVRLFILSVVLKFALSFNIQPNLPTFLRPQNQANPTAEPNFFGYNLNIGRDGNDDLK